MSYPLPYDGLKFEVSYAEALDCGLQTVPNSGNTLRVLNGLSVISGLKPSSCYNLTIKPVASGFVRGESQTIVCRTALTGEGTKLNNFYYSKIRVKFNFFYTKQHHQES